MLKLLIMFSNADMKTYTIWIYMQSIISKQKHTHTRTPPTHTPTRPEGGVVLRLNIYLMLNQ